MQEFLDALDVPVVHSAVDLDAELMSGQFDPRVGSGHDFYAHCWVGSIFAELTHTLLQLTMLEVCVQKSGRIGSGLEKATSRQLFNVEQSSDFYRVHNYSEWTPVVSDKDV